MQTVCEICGVTGFSEHLILCNVCKNSAQHLYCLDKSQDSDGEDESDGEGGEVIWLCEQCELEKQQEDVSCLTGKMLQTPEVSSAERQSLEITKLTKREGFKGSGASLKGSQLCNELIKGDEKKSRRLIIDDKNEGPVLFQNSGSTVTQPIVSGVFLFEASNHQSIEHISDSPDFSGVTVREVHKHQRVKGSDVLSEEGDERSRLCSTRTIGDMKKRRRLIIDEEIDDENISDSVSVRSPDSGSAVTHPVGVSCAVFKDSKHQSVDQVCDSCDVLTSVTVLKASTHKTDKQVSEANDDLAKLSCEVTSRGVYHENGLTKPIIDPIWRGSFETGGKTYGPIAAHISNKACLRVLEGAKMLPQMLCAERLPRCDVWPSRFQKSPPDDEAIGLYFFAESGRDKTTFSQLLKDIIEWDLALKIPLDDAELLIFSSLLLPKSYWRFQDNCYLWGVFRAKQVTCTAQELCVSQDKNGSVSKNCNQEPHDYASAEEGNLGDVSLSMFDGSGFSTDSVSIADNEDLYAPPCLNLFPLTQENMAIKAGIVEDNGLNLDLGLSRGPLDDSNKLSRCKLDIQLHPSPTPGKLLFESWNKFTRSLRSQSVSSSTSV